MWLVSKKKRKQLVGVMLSGMLLLGGWPSAALVDFVVDQFGDRRVVDSLYWAQKDSRVIDGRMRDLLKPGVAQAQAADFQMQTGYYMGTGASRSITGVGFQPDLVLIKSNTTAGVAAFKTSAMAAANTAFVDTTSDNTASQVTLNADGFSVGTIASVNSSNVRYVWTAFSGSDCTSTGTFCVGQYTGNATSPRKITTGFQPSLVIVKRTTNIGGHFLTASMSANNIRYLSGAVTDTTGNFIRDLQSDGFNVGHSGTTGDNVNGAVYNYIAFKTTPGIFAEGFYTGDGVDNRSISGVGFKPSMVLVKNGTNVTATNTTSVFNLEESYGDNSSIINANGNIPNLIQALEADGFQVGTHVRVNNVGDTHYWLAFGGAPSLPAASGNFEMELGSYTGNGTGVTINSLDFAPDLVIVKDNATGQSVFRTSLMAGDVTAYLGAATADFAGGITALTANGFTIGTSTVTNTNGVTYQWQAFGNAYKPHTNSGATDFMIGAYYGSATDNRNITRLPWQADFLTVKRNGASAAVFKTSAHTGETTSFLSTTADGATNYIQAFTSDGFQVGNAGNNINASAVLYRWFAFKNGSNFQVGTYTGNGTDNRDISAGFQPDLVWVKRNTAVAGVHRPSSLVGDATQYFVNTANAAGRIKEFISTGFRLGTQTEVNTSGATYRYASWKKPTPTPVVSVSVTTDGTVAYGVLGSADAISTIDLADTQTVLNESNVAVDLNIKTSQPAGWTVGATPATDVFVHEFSINSGGVWTKFTASEQYQSLATNVGLSGLTNFDLRFTAPDPSTTSNEKTLTITVQAVAAQ